MSSWKEDSSERHDESGLLVCELRKKLLSWLSREVSCTAEAGEEVGEGTWEDMIRGERTVIVDALLSGGRDRVKGNE